MCKRNRYEVIVIRGGRIVLRVVFGNRAEVDAFVARKRASGCACEVKASTTECAHSARLEVIR
jgi:hypothetical protein